ncbi:MAG TPA: 4Fe-4S dicluster domain-containing protein [Phycisphaerales bacterium]|nr:4Fe-4S dicluster domain-containing protein [Phycisphaerales bacterium]
MAGKITIDTERCKGCGLCVAVCPKNCIVISERSNKTGYYPAQACPDSALHKNDGCTGCAMCAIICPDVVIEVSRDNDAVETIRKSSLLKTK